MIHFYNTLIHSIFLLFSFYSFMYRFWFYSFLAIFYPVNSPVPSAALWGTFLIAAFKESSPVFVAASSNSIHYFLDRFLPNGKKFISFSILSCLWFSRITCHLYFLISKITLSPISNVLSFWLVNGIVTSSKSVLYK